MESSRFFISTIENQFSRLCHMWRDEIKNIPDDEWRKSDIDYMIPARHFCHVMVSADFYTNEYSVEDFDWNALCGGDWESIPNEQLPAKHEAIQILNDIQSLVESRLQKLNDDDLQEKEKIAPWAGDSVIEKMIYWLRHFQHHLGEVHAELRRRDIPRAKWK